MATTFPTNKKDFTNEIGSDDDYQDDPSLITFAQNIADTVEALQDKVGVDNSTDSDSLDYKVRKLPYVTVAPSGGVGDYVCDGTDDDVEIQQAIDSLSSDGGTVKLKEGTYNISSTIEVDDNIVFEGSGWGTILKLADGADCDVIENSDQTNGNSNIAIRDLKIDGNKANQTAGNDLNGIDFIKTTDFLINNVWIKDIGTSDVADVGIGFSFSTDCINGRITNCISEANTHYGFNSYNCSYLTFANNISKDNLRHGFGSANGSNHISWVGNIVKNNSDQGFWIRNTSYSSIIGNIINMPTSSDNGIQLKMDTGDTNQISEQHNTISGNTIEGSCNYGIHIQNHARYNTITGNTIQGSAVYGVYLIAEWNIFTNNNIFEVIEDGIYSTGTGTIIKGNFIKKCGKNGIYSNAYESIITNNICVSNSTSSAGTYNGIELGARSRNVISNNRCYDDQGTKTQGYGIKEASGNTYNVIEGNNLWNNLTGSASLAGSYDIVRNNQGYTTENSGTATISNGSTSVTVNHGLAVTPSAGDIMVTPMESLGNATKFYIDTYTSTQFTIHLDQDPGQDVDFAWKAIVL